MNSKGKRALLTSCLAVNALTILKWYLLIIVAVAGLCIFHPSNVEAAPYTFIDIANTNNLVTPFTHFRDAPSINNETPNLLIGGTNPATVAFWGATAGNESLQGIYTGNGTTPTNTITTIADNSTPYSESSFGLNYSNFRRNPDINDDGTVVFNGGDGFGGGISTGNGGAVTTHYATNGPDFSNFTSNPAINNDGTVAFWGETKSAGSFGGIFRGNAVTPTNIVDDSGVFDVSIRRSPDINSGGTVVFNAPLDAGGERISTGNGVGTSTRVDTNDGVFSSFGDAPSINNGGSVAFQGVHNLLGEGIFTDNSGLSTIADSTGAFSFFGGSPSINNNGLVAFSAGLDGGGQGIFTGSDPVADLVIQTGDVLFGSTLSSYEFGHHGLNDSGQLAFRYFLADGTQGIALASSVQGTIPEPTTFALLGIGLAGLGGGYFRRRRKQRQADRNQK